MKRRQLFEFTDLDWWPQGFRFLLTDFLNMYTQLIRPFDRKMDLLYRAVRSSDTNRVVDLCSGAGGPWPALHNELEAALGEAVEVQLTDKFPPPGAGDDLVDLKRISYLADQSIDATKVPKQLPGVRTLFDGLHHFEPEMARAIIADAVEQRQGIVVFELLRRNFIDLIPMLLAFVHVLLLTPLVRPFSLQRLLLTYVVPVAPFFIAWDGSVSILRCYTPDELQAMIDSIDGSADYEWEVGEYKKAGLFPVTYMAGWPKVNEKVVAGGSQCRHTNQ